MKHRSSVRGVGLAFLVASVAWLGCASAFLPSNDATVICVSKNAKGSCQITRNFPSSSQQSLTNQCTNGGGTVASACPTTGLLGCCTSSFSGGDTYVSESCYYTGDGAELKRSCGAGTWSATQ